MICVSPCCRKAQVRLAQSHKPFWHACLNPIQKRAICRFFWKLAPPDLLTTPFHPPFSPMVWTDKVRETQTNFGRVWQTELKKVVNVTSWWILSQSECNAGQESKQDLVCHARSHAHHYKNKAGQFIDLLHLLSFTYGNHVWYIIMTTTTMESMGQRQSRLMMMFGGRFLEMCNMSLSVHHICNNG
jgi:hypothetical protein